MNKILKIIICSSAFILTACSSQSPAKIEYRTQPPQDADVQGPVTENSKEAREIREKGAPVTLEDDAKDKYQEASEVTEEPVEDNAKAEQVYKISDKVGPQGQPAIAKTEAAAPGAEAEKPQANSGEQTYTVTKAETLFSISRKFGVPILPIISANNLQQPYILSAGQVIKIPAGKYHEVKKGETLYSISREYNVDMSGIVKLNDLQMPYNVVEGQKLQIPFPTDLPKDEKEVAAAASAPVAAESVPQKETTTQPQEQRAVYAADKAGPASLRRNSGGILGQIVTNKSGQVVSSTPAPAASETATVAASEKTPAKEETVEKSPVQAVDDGKFMWPVNGKIVKKFGQSGSEYNDGINISAPAGTKVLASNPGRVVYTGNSLKSYGNLVIIKHDNGLLSAYAHMNSVLVKKDEIITKGQEIGTVGSTGKVISPQLYFAIREGKDAKNPLSYLPKQSG